jgi:hypothetical protein
MRQGTDSTCATLLSRTVAVDYESIIYRGDPPGRPHLKRNLGLGHSGLHERFQAFPGVALLERLKVIIHQ